MIFAHGSRFGGHALFVKDGKLVYAGKEQTQPIRHAFLREKSPQLVGHRRPETRFPAVSRSGRRPARRSDGATPMTSAGNSPVRCRGAVPVGVLVSASPTTQQPSPLTPHGQDDLRLSASGIRSPDATMDSRPPDPPTERDATPPATAEQIVARAAQKGFDPARVAQALGVTRHEGTPGIDDEQPARPDRS